VCRQTVLEPPAAQVPDAVTGAQERLAAAEQSLLAAREAAAAARTARAQAEQTMDDVRAELASVDAELSGQPGAERVAAALASLTEAEAALAAARERERTARQAARLAGERARAATQQRETAWRVFDTARDGVAALGPPPVDRADLRAAWATLLDWCAQERDRQAKARVSAAEDIAEVDARRAALEGDLVSACSAAGITGATDHRSLRDATAEMLARAGADTERIAEAIERRKLLTAEREQQAEAAAVAGTLSRHLSARGFERWLLDEALQRLAHGASAVLRDLSGGQYSLAIDEQRNFGVVDHRNADERRSARTLSGGETFLASLALALTLAEHLAELAVDAEPRLESIFLDEGFGTLDADTLDVVAASIEELGSRGRTVGVVTHVRELAERVPVRFEVRKSPTGSTVERVAL
jgi:DNA repair protein SbcC/Rad50